MKLVNLGFQYEQMKCSMFTLIKQNLPMSWSNFVRMGKVSHQKKLTDW